MKRKSFKVAMPKMKRGKMPNMKVASVKNPSFKGMERNADAFGKKASSRVAQFNKGRV